MIHGFGCGGDVFSSFAKRFSMKGWRCEAPTLFESYRVKRNPSALLRQLTFEDYVASAADYAKRLQLEEGARPVILGHSLGGLIAQRLVAMDLASKGVFLASIPPAEMEGSQAFSTLAFANLLLGKRGSDIKAWRLGIEWSLLNAVSRDDRKIILDNLRFEAPDIFECMMQRNEAAISSGLIDVRDIRVPTLTVAGRKDRLVPLEVGEQIGRKYASADYPGDFLEVGAGGHWLVNEPTTSGLCNMLLDWMEEQHIQTTHTARTSS